jgi:hypothetical protein
VVVDASVASSKIDDAGYPAQTMVDTPAFDPYELLGVGRDADEVVIQLAYRARIRDAHPDVAGSTGLELAKRLNVARDWLLDPARRSQLTPPTPTGPKERRAARRAGGAWTDRRAGRAGQGRTDAWNVGAHADELRSFLWAVEQLSPDERARLNYSLGDAPPPDLAAYLEYLDPSLQARSRALRDAVERVWASGLDEAPPSVPRLGRLLPSGFLAANAYAQWLLLQDALSEELAGMVVGGTAIAGSLAARCTGPWQASLGQPRYGPRHAVVLSFMGIASAMPAEAAGRLASSWRRHLGRDGRGHPSEHIGPGAWLPTPSHYPEVLKVSGFLAAVDASRIVPPRALDERHHAGFVYGLRLTAHVLAMGLDRDPGRDYLVPWRAAVGPGQWLGEHSGPDLRAS